MAKYIYISIVAIILIGCRTTREVGLLQERESLPSYQKAEFQTYRLRVNDEIALRVISSNKEGVAMFQMGTQSQLNTQSQIGYRVYPDGTIDIPFISKIEVLGKTCEEAESIINTKVKEYLPDAQVKIALTTSTFCVIGQAGKGYYPIYKEYLTIYQALALCGGVSNSGNFSKVKIIRQADNEDVKIVEFDVRTKSIIESEYYYIYPNDIIYVDYSKKNFWAIDSYAGFLGVVTASITLLLTVFNLVIKK